MEIKLLGLGGCGCNFLEYLTRNSSIHIETYGINADISILSRKNIPKKAYLEFNRVWIFDAKESQWFFYEDVNSFYGHLLRSIRLLILVYGTGGKAGCHIALNVNKLAKQYGIFTANVAILPFSFEGPQRAKISQNVLSEVSKYSDLLYLLRNDELLKSAPPDLKISKMFEIFHKRIIKFVEMMLNFKMLDNL